jgi:hypothetical protein
MPRYANSVAKHRMPGAPKMNWLFRRGESTWRGFITFTACCLALATALFIAA